MSFLEQSVLFLAAAVIAVPVTRRLGLGAVLGYLAGGIVIGPWGLALVGEVETVFHIAEIGVVLLLFIIGLEVEPTRLWTMRRYVFGLGAAQVLLSAAALGLLAALAGLGTAAAVVAGFALALSSTAFALQLLAEKKALTSRHGRAAFSVLLFQDLAVVPLLALVPLLGAGVGAGGDPLWAVVEALGVIVLVVLIGRYLIRYALRMIAATGIDEIFTAAALLTVVGTALVMEAVGLSMALGAFIAGMLLADSDYRHALEADIGPFKGLLLGLFFIAVGMSVNVGLILERPVLVLALAVGLVAVKAAVLWPLARLFGLDGAPARRLAGTISQGGEFAFVLFALAVGAGVMERSQVDLLIAVVIVSMALTPLLLEADERLIGRLGSAPAPAPAEPIGQAQTVIIAGFGRVGQIVARTLRARGIAFTALEIRPEQVDFVRRYGNRIYYGDAARLEMLRAANARSARAIVVAVDDPEAALRIVRIAKVHFPEVAVFARAHDRQHAYRLMDLGADGVVRETFHSSLVLARQLLAALGLSDWQSERTVEAFRAHDERVLAEQFAVRDDEQKMILLTRRAAEELEALFGRDAGPEAAPDGGTRAGPPPSHRSAAGHADENRGAADDQDRGVS